MKQILLLTALFTSAAAIAQPTLTLSNFNLAPGQTFYEYPCTGTGITPGPAGASVTWNYSSLVSMSQDTIIYRSCASTPYCDSFPGATMAMEYLGSGGFFGYVKASTADASLLGYDAPGIGAIHFSKLRTLMQFPATYNTFYPDSFAYSFPGTPAVYSGLDSNMADAYGTLILPSGTHTNVLRIHRKTHEKDSSSGSVYYSYNETYTWYKAGFSSPLLILNYYDTSGMGTLSLTDILYYAAGPNTSSVNEKASAYPEFVSYPNPASDILHIKLGQNNENTEIILTDPTGRIVKQMNVSDKKEIELDITGLPAGMYIAQLKCPPASATQKVIIAR